jgi:diguanylate cyclase (GGDEF)-like protein
MIAAGAGCVRSTTDYIRKFAERAFQAVSGDLSFDQLRDLLYPGDHAPIIQSRRAVLIHSRVRMVAATFAILTPPWMLIDILIFDWPLWGCLALLRLVASAANFAILFGVKVSDDIDSARRGLAALLAVPIIFYLVSHPLLNQGEMIGQTGAVTAGYAFLPFVMVAGLSVFPITALEGAVFAVPLLAAHLAAGLWGSLVFPFPSYFGALWLLLLITTVATLAGISQLHFMMALVDQASHDGLTGAYARRIGEELLRFQYAHCRRYKHSMALVFLDLDNFKSINDRYGHDQGDRALRAAAEAMREILRQTDVLIRWGGEEFIIAMPNTPHDGAVKAVSRLLTRGLGQRPDGSTMTASIGVAEFLHDQPESLQHLIDMADNRMYLAKQSGKDRVVSDSAPQLVATE